MRFLSESEIKEFLSQKDYDIRVSHNARWIDQKCTPDVLTIISDCIVNYVIENGNDYFTSKDIWYNTYTVKNVENIFKKPNPNETKARNEYDKFFQQPMELLAYAGILEKDNSKRRNFYRVSNNDLLEYIALREKNALTFLHFYIESVLADSGIICKFNDFFNNISKESFKALKDDFEDFTKSNTPINGHYECGRIFTKIINPLAFFKGTFGTEGGHLSKHKITYDMLMYNRGNFRDIYSDKPKEMTRSEYEQSEHIKINKDLTKYMSAKAKRIVRVYNDQFRNGKTEVLTDKQHIDDLATNIHHIFPEADYPTICFYIENLIALTPTQHFNYAHPNGNTQMINKEYQHICLLAKSDTIREDLEKHKEPIYSFEKFLYVLFTGLELESFMEIEYGDYDGLIATINLAYV